jgi:acyl phosphate:glycerol-3-phosphate acyltransferase
MNTVLITPALLVLAGYILGSVPFGLLLTRMFGAGDLRQIGSGNIGATNVLRTGRKGLAIATLLLDLLKGVAAVWLAYLVAPTDAPLAGAAAVLGHLYPVWLRFRGGKGVATLMGVVVALSWPMGLVYAAVWIGTLLVLRISSLGGMLAALSVPASAWLIGRLDLLPLGAVLAALVVWRHRDNIGRLIAGTEPRMGASKNEPGAS